jgi:hypothetical protein
LVSSSYFSLFGANMALGRGFLPEEERTPGGSPVVVLSHYFWERAFKSDPQVTGQTVRLSGQPFVVVGVTAKEFIFLLICGTSWTLNVSFLVWATQGERKLWLGVGSSMGPRYHIIDL